MTDKTISKQDIDKMVKEIKTQDSETSKLKGYISNNKTEVFKKIKEIGDKYKKRYNIMKFLIIIDLIYLVLFVSASNFVLQLFSIISIFVGFNIFFRIRMKNYLGILGSYVYYLFFLFITVFTNINELWSVYDNLYGYIFILFFLYCHLVFFADRKFVLNKLMIVFYLMLVMIIYFTYLGSMYLDINDSLMANVSVGESLNICEDYEGYRNFCEYSIIRLNNQSSLNNCINLSTNISKMMCVNYIKKRENINCSIVGNLSVDLLDFCS